MSRVSPTILFLLFFAAIVMSTASAQEAAEGDSLRFVPPSQVSTEIHPDSSVVSNEKPVKLVHGVPQSKSPAWAAVRSAILPGWGQAYVDNWIFAAVFAGAEAGLVYGAYVQHDRYVTALDKSTNVKKDEDRIILEESANFYRDDRNKLIWYIAGLTILSSLDAYVEAHLYDFHIDPLLQTPPAGDGAQVGFRITFSL